MANYQQQYGFAMQGMQGMQPASELKLKDQAPRYNPHQQPSPPQQQQQPQPQQNYQSSQPRMRYSNSHSRNSGPPPVTNKVKKKMKNAQNKYKKSSLRNRHSSSSAGPPLNDSSSDDGVEDELDEHGHVVISTGTDTSSNNTHISYSNHKNGHQSTNSHPSNSQSFQHNNGYNGHNQHNQHNQHNGGSSSQPNGYQNNDPYNHYNMNGMNHNNHNNGYRTYNESKQNDYNGYNRNNGYHQNQNSSGYVPPYKFNPQQVQQQMQNMSHHQIQHSGSYNNDYSNQPHNNYPHSHQHSNPPPQSQQRRAVPPPLPTHKMKDYGKKASSKNVYNQYNNNPSSSNPSGFASNTNVQHQHNRYYNNAHNNKQQQQQGLGPNDYLMNHPVSDGDDGQFAKSFDDQFDDNILGINDSADLDNFAPIHYDQRLASHQRDLVSSSYKQQHQQQYAPSSEMITHNESLTQYSRSSASDSAAPNGNKNNNNNNNNIPPPPGPPPADPSQINKQLSKQKRKHNNQSKRPSTSGIRAITVTQHPDDTYDDENAYKPETPSRSKSQDNGSETREDDIDFDEIQKDRDYRPSIIMDLQHDDIKLQVTIDRYGFPMDEGIDEKEHRKQVKKENARLLKWQDMIFNKKSGGTAAEADNEVDQQIKHWNSVKNHRKLKSRIRKGVPQQLRGTVWQNLSGARERRKIECARYGSKTLYNDLRGKKRSTYHDQIWKDINRTYRKNLAYGASQLATANNNAKNTQANKNGANVKPKSTQKFFKAVIIDASVVVTPQDLEKHATPAQLALYNVLKAFSLYRKDIGYCQGMQAVTALLLMYMTEEEAFWVLASLADDTKYQMDNLWRPNMPAIQLRFYQMERLVRITLPKLSSHFEKNGIVSASMYQATQWFITIFLATSMKFGTITKIWDIYLNEGLKTVFRMGIGFLKYYEKQLLKSDFEEMLEIFRTGPAKLEPEAYIETCFKQRITHAQLAAFEKDFNRQQQKRH